MAQILEGKVIAKELKSKLKEERKEVKTPSLASLKVGNNKEIDVYINSQKRLAKELNVDYQLCEVSEKEGAEGLISTIERLNKDERIKGIIVHRPLPSSYDEQKVFSSIEPKKDIEGMHPYNLGRLMLGGDEFISPTVLSIFEFIQYTGIELYGKNVVIVGASFLVGKPLSLLLVNHFSTVTITHIGTYQKGHLPFYVSNADVVISCVGKPGLIKGEWIKQGAIVIDGGISKAEGKIKGDVEFASAEKKAGFITPVPGGVGMLTALFLFKNLLKAARQ